ncbi:MAG: DNA-binding transcriptional LysR family regulator [Alteromonadaceae bacterium]|jgi:DNA-binding transcriptional LysR family regulator
MDIFNSIPIFVAVADNQGFSSAAKALGVSKSAVSKRITQLENQLGARLFHRTTRKLSMTEAGECFYQYAVQANRAGQQAAEAVNELKGEPRGVLKVQLPMTLGQIVISPLIPTFLASHPHLKIDLVLDDRQLNLIENGYDLALRVGSLADSSLIARPLAPLHSVVCVAPNFYLQHKSYLQQPEQLVDINCLTYSYSSNADVWQFNSIANPKETIKINVVGNYRVNNSAALRDALLSGVGVGRLPTFVAKQAIQKGELIPLFQDYEMPVKQLYAIYPERNYLPEKVRVFLDFIIDNLGHGKNDWDGI